MVVKFIHCRQTGAFTIALTITKCGNVLGIQDVVVFNPFETLRGPCNVHCEGA